MTCLGEADTEVKCHRQEGHEEGPPDVEAEHRVIRPCDHQDDGGGRKDRRGHQEELVEDVEARYIVVHADRLVPRRQQVHHVGQRGGRPPPALVEELVERFRGKGQSVGSRAVVDTVTLLQEQCTEPPIFTCNEQPQPQNLYKHFPNLSLSHP